MADHVAGLRFSDREPLIRVMLRSQSSRNVVAKSHPGVSRESHGDGVHYRDRLQGSLFGCSVNEHAT